MKSSFSTDLLNKIFRIDKMAAISVNGSAHVFLKTIGLLKQIDGSDFFITKKGRTGIAMYGPYIGLQPGRYIAEFVVSTEYYKSHSTIICGAADVCSDMGRCIIAHSKLFLRKSCQAHLYLPFTLSAPATVEFRVYTNGRTGLYIKTNRMIYHIHDEDNAVLTCYTHDDKRLKKLSDFMWKNGGSITVIDGDMIVSWNGLAFYIRNTEEFYTMILRWFA